MSKQQMGKITFGPSKRVKTEIPSVVLAPADHLHPSLSLLAKLGSVLVHVDELLSTKGHNYDRIALTQALVDPEIKQWVKDMGPLLPLKR